MIPSIISFNFFLTSMGTKDLEEIDRFLALFIEYLLKILVVFFEISW